MISKVIFVSGWFDQRGGRIGLNPDETEPALYDGEHHTLFTGYFGFLPTVSLEEVPTEVFTGKISDVCGIAEVKGALTKQSLTFNKRYAHRPDAIAYTFVPHQSGTFWVGEYSGELVGKKNARLVLSEPPPGFFA